MAKTTTSRRESRVPEREMRLMRALEAVQNDNGIHPAAKAEFNDTTTPKVLEVTSNGLYHGNTDPNTKARLLGRAYEYTKDRLSFLFRGTQETEPDRFSGD